MDPAPAADPQLDPDLDILRDSWPWLARLGRLLSGSAEVGEDLAQEAILGLLRRGPVDSPRAYLRRSVVNLAINAGRKSAREHAQLRLVAGQLRGYDIKTDDELWPLIVQLPERQRAVLVLRYYEDLSEVEIARILGCRPGTVKSLASRALGKLREELTS